MSEQTTGPKLETNTATALVLVGLLGFLILVRRGFRGYYPTLGG